MIKTGKTSLFKTFIRHRPERGRQDDQEKRSECSSRQENKNSQLKVGYMAAI
jgi:hypothetical protein